MITGYHLFSESDSQLKIELLSLQFTDDSDAEELASTVPNPDLYLVFQADTSGWGKYKYRTANWYYPRMGVLVSLLKDL